MCAWYQKGKNFIQQQPIPSYFQIVNREQCSVQKLLEQQSLFDDCNMIKTTLQQCEKMTHTQVNRWKRVQKVRNYILIHFYQIIDKCSEYSLKITTNSCEEQQQKDKCKHRYIHKSMELLKFILSIDLIQNVKQPTAKMQIQKRMTFHVFSKMMENFLSCNESDQMCNTLYPGYLLQLFSILLNSRIHEIPLLQSFKSNPQITVKTLTELHRFIRYNQICETVKLLIRLKTSITIIQSNGVNYPVKSSDNQHPIRIKLAICQPLLEKLINNIIQLSKNNQNSLDQKNKISKCQQQIVNTINVFEHIFMKYNQIPNFQQLIDLINSKSVHFSLLKVLPRMLQIEYQNLNASCFVTQIVSAVFSLIKSSLTVQVPCKQNMIDLIGVISSILFGKRGNIVKPKLYHLKLFELLIAFLKLPNIQEEILYELLVKTQICEFCYQVILSYPSNNIIIKAIDSFFFTIFFEKKVKMMEYLYSDFGIIEKTISILNDFKRQNAFGVVFSIIKYYTTMKIDSPVVLSAIQKNLEKWNDFYQRVLKPHVNLQSNPLGQIQYPKGSKEQQILAQIQFKTMNDQILVTDCRNSQLNQSRDIKMSMISSFSIPIQASANELVTSKQSLDQQVLSVPIQLSFDEKKDQNQETQSLKSSFESFSAQIQSQTFDKGALKQVLDFQNKAEQQEIQITNSSYKEFIEKSKSKIEFSSRASRSNSSVGQKKRTKMKSVDSRKKNRWQVSQNQEQSQIIKPKINSLPKQLKKQNQSKIDLQQLQKYSEIRLIKISQRHKRQSKASTQRVINPERDFKIFNLLKLISAIKQ